MPQCLAIPRECLAQLAFLKDIYAPQQEEAVHAFKYLEPQEIEQLLAAVRQHKLFRKRFGEGGAETDPSLQQIILYGMLVKGTTFFAYQRGTQEGSETRLASRLSAGVGGHIEPFDSDIIDSLYREIDEEVRFTRNGAPISLRTAEGALDMDAFRRIASVEIAGIIKNDSDEVGKVHLGLFCIVRILSEGVDAAISDGDENVSGSFVSMAQYEELVRAGAQPEAWTQLVIQGVQLAHRI